MKPWIHLLTSSILALAFYPAFNWKVLFILAGGILIDFDHYLWYVYKYRKFSFIGCYNHFIIDARKNNLEDVMGILLVFHTIEFLIMMVLLSFYSESALMFTIGLLSQYFLDLIWQYSVPKRLFITNPSIILWIYKNKIQKQRKSWIFWLLILQVKLKSFK